MSHIIENWLMRPTHLVKWKSSPATTQARRVPPPVKPDHIPRAAIVLKVNDASATDGVDRFAVQNELLWQVHPETPRHLGRCHDLLHKGGMQVSTLVRCGNK